MSRDRLESVPNTVTGREMEVTLPPEMSRLRMYLMTLLCAYSLSSLLTTSSPSFPWQNSPSKK